MKYFVIYPVYPMAPNTARFFFLERCKVRSEAERQSARAYVADEKEMRKKAEMQ